MTILAMLTKGNIDLNGKSQKRASRARTAINNGVSLLLKGYNLDEPIEPLIKKYKTFDQIPDARIDAGKNMTSETMRIVGELIFPKVPHNHIFMFMMFPADQKNNTANYISNGERADMVVALRNLADKLEGGKVVPMPESN